MVAVNPRTPTGELLSLIDDLATAIVQLHEELAGKDLAVDSYYGKLVKRADNAIAAYTDR